MARLVSRVRKRDGSEESFDGPRLADSLRAAGPDLPDHGWAEELVEVIRLELGPRPGPIQTSEIARVAVSVLRQSSMRSIAQDYLDFRTALEEAVSRLRVHTRRGRQSTSRPWDRHRLALSLVRDRYLDLTTARRVASLVERRLIMADLGHVTGRLVTSLADNECRSLGIRSDPLTTEFVGVDRSELRAWLGGDCLPSVMGPPHLGPEGGDLRPALGEELLARFAIEEVLTPAQAEGISVGSYYLPHLGDWMRPARLRLSWDSQVSEDSFWKQVRECSQLTHELQVFVPKGAAWTDFSQDAPVWLEGRSVRMRWATSVPELARRWAQAGSWVRLPAAAFAEASPSLQTLLAETGRVTLSWQPPKRLPPASERVRSEVQGMAVINLARCAFEAGAWQAADFLEEVGHSLTLACSSLQALSLRGRGVEHARICLLPAGLEPALKTIFPDESLEGDRVRRTVLSLRALFDRHAKNADLRSEHSAPPHPGPAGTRLAEQDGLTPESSYTVGWGLFKDTLVPCPVSFHTAPWLQFPAAAALLDSSWMERLPRRSDIAES